MKKALLAMILVFSMLFLLVGCGDVSSADNDASPNNQATNEGEQVENGETTNENVEYITMGSYEQDGNLNNGPEPIQWIPLLEKDGKVLLISRYIIDYKPFNESTVADATNWQDSSLRMWLNGEFMDTAFTSAEQNRMVKVEVQDYRADGVLGGTTTDKVFLLNKDQAFTYFTSDSDRATTSTAYAKTQKSYVTNGYWLINSYSSDLYKCLINSEGRNENNPRVNEKDGVRPVIWISK